MKRIILTVTNDLRFDQRMQRICTSLSKAGYEVELCGRSYKHAPALDHQPYRQRRLYCFFKKGPLFYAEFNIRLFLKLLFSRADCVVAIDLDTILPCLCVSKLKGWQRIYDAHELFCEMKEVVTRPSRYRWWKAIERWAVPQFTYGYTVNQPIADVFFQMYGVKYQVIRNVPFRRPVTQNLAAERFILYQGAVNEGRSFETLIPAMQWVDAPLWICGEGNFMQQCKRLVKTLHLEHKVFFKGRIPPEELWNITQQATIGITLFENNGLNNYLSLANRFFDYIQAGVPQLCVNYPAYAAINADYDVALLIDDLSPNSIATALNHLLTNDVLYNRLRENCKHAAAVFNWTEEEKKLLAFYRSIL